MIIFPKINRWSCLHQEPSQGFPEILSSGRPYYDLAMYTAQVDEVFLSSKESPSLQHFKNLQIVTPDSIEFFYLKLSEILSTQTYADLLNVYKSSHPKAYSHSNKMEPPTNSWPDSKWFLLALPPAAPHLRCSSQARSPRSSRHAHLGLSDNWAKALGSL